MHHPTLPYTPTTAEAPSATFPPAWLTNTLRHAAAHVEASTGIKPQLLSTRSLRPGGATALLCAGADTNCTPATETGLTEPHDQTKPTKNNPDLNPKSVYPTQNISNPVQTQQPTAPSD